MENIILFIMFFIVIYLIYYFVFIRKQIKYNKNKVFSDVKLLESYYKINVKKIGYQKVLRILNFVNEYRSYPIEYKGVKDDSIFKDYKARFIYDNEGNIVVA